eukprot:TRINITY_DN51393_c0_g1_i1.p1 TRINITY_DN51393_c0_g1~~TRINITY_DN51393_c0_g1_i1.p1  ORF type:complete len:237 (-),score=30.27 TRINITY_DN51393_c0_g1_i1:93-782(-)
MPALWWIRQLAKRVLKVRRETNGAYMVLAPDVGVRSSQVDKYPDGLSDVTANFIKQLMKMASDEGLDAIDCHLHMANMQLLKTAISKVKSLTSVPLVTLEWSQAPVVSLSGWLYKTRTLEPFGEVTNLKFITKSYATRVTEDQWATFMSNSPYDASFMQQAFSHIEAQGFLYATYGAAFQYGNPKFDSKQLVASMTVVGGRAAMPRNEPVYSWFQGLVQSQVQPAATLV